MHAHTLSLYLPSRTKLQNTLQLRGQILSPYFISTNMYVLRGSNHILNSHPITNALWASLKVHKHDIFLKFFAEAESLWSQGPVTRDF
jgi:hypothetical protein